MPLLFFFPLPKQHFWSYYNAQSYYSIMVEYLQVKLSFSTNKIYIRKKKTPLPLKKIVRKLNPYNSTVIRGCTGLSFTTLER